MTLAQRGLRSIAVDKHLFSWKVQRRHGELHVVVQIATGDGRLLIAHFDPHDLFTREGQARWTRTRQIRAVTSGSAARLIRHALANGWVPDQRGMSPFVLHTWQAHEIDPLPLVGTMADGEVALCTVADEAVSDLRFDLSLNPTWRARLFGSPPHQRWDIPQDDPMILAKARALGLRFRAFNDGWTSGGHVVFGIESVEFPHVTMFTTNNPHIVDWGQVPSP